MDEASASGPLADLRFAGQLFEWRGPAPFFFVVVPPALVGELRHAARHASYGWGVVPVEAAADDVQFRTSLFPRDGGYLMPIEAAVRREAGLAAGALVSIRLLVRDAAAQR